MTSHDGKTVTVRLSKDKGTEEFTKFWQSMIDEGLIDIRTTTWSQRWKNGVGAGKIASVLPRSINTFLPSTRVMTPVMISPSRL